jgi:hypothetical protein
MKALTAFPSKFLKHDDVAGKPVLTITKATYEDVGSGANVERKIVLTFAETEKRLVLNMVNTNSVIEIVGDDETDSWPGHKIQLVPSRTEFQGKRVPCVRIDRPDVGF